MNTKYDPEVYKNAILPRTCKYCGNSFLGTGKQVVCSKECTTTARKNKDPFCFWITQCHTCLTVIKKVPKFIKTAESKLYLVRCSNCCKERRAFLVRERSKARTERNKLDVENFEEVIFADGKVRVVNIEKRLQTKKRMLENNPMKRPEISEKVSQIFKEKIESGEITYKKGACHHLWKGNRSNNKYIRVRLLPWIKEVQKLHNWKCDRCSSNIKLEVHHTEPLRIIIGKFVKYPLSEYSQDSDDFEELINTVLKYHYDNMHIGQLLCQKCHCEIDSFRQQTIKNENKKH